MSSSGGGGGVGSLNGDKGENAMEVEESAATSVAANAATSKDGDLEMGDSRSAAINEDEAMEEEDEEEEEEEVDDDEEDNGEEEEEDAHGKRGTL